VSTGGARTEAPAPAPAASPAAARREGPASPTDAARATIRFLADHKLAPTPGNYRRAWSEVGGPAADADVEQVAQAAVRLLSRRVEPDEPGFDGLSSAVRERRWDDALDTLTRLVRQAPRGRWSPVIAALGDAAGRPSREWPLARRLEAVVAAAHEHRDSDLALRAQLELLLDGWSTDSPVVVAATDPDREGGAPPAAAPSVEPVADAHRAMAKLRKVNAELTEIVVSLCDSVESVADEGSWIISQVDAVRDAVRGGADRRSLAAARQLLQQARVTQHAITRSRRDAVTSLRDLLPHLVQQMAHLGDHANAFGDTLNGHLEAISNADSLERIAERVRGLIADSQSVHETFTEVRRDLGERSQRASALESEVERLELELAQASERLLTDHLTRTANRAGLERAFEQALQTLCSSGDTLAIALLDIDDFKKVNDSLGHRAGDGVLRHLAGLLQAKLRTGDTVARYGGEEFVILLPGVTDVQASEILVRVQRELTREVYLHGTTRVFVTFSAGTTLVEPQDSLESAIGRADDAMYQAKNAGKNCVAIA
jgi:diguanylate cyclase (GGDEF)-like protein